MRFIFSYVKRHIGIVIFAITLKTAASMGELLLPYILEHLIDDVVPKADMTKVILWGIGTPVECKGQQRCRKGGKREYLCHPKGSVLENVGSVRQSGR